MHFYFFKKKFKNKIINNGAWFCENGTHRWQLLSISINDDKGISIHQIIKLQDYLTVEEREAKINKANQKMLNSYFETKNKNFNLYK